MLFDSSPQMSGTNKRIAKNYRMKTGCITCGEQDPEKLSSNHIDPKLKTANIAAITNMKKLKEELVNLFLHQSNFL